MLSSEDPIRVWQQFATLDLLSNGRAEIMAGRGSFVESFPLFGFDLDHYDELFEEKLQMLLEIRKGGKVTWAGSTHTKPIPGIEVYPNPTGPAALWIAVGDAQLRVARAAISTASDDASSEAGRAFPPLVPLYRDTARKMNHPATMPVGIPRRLIADTSQEAIDIASGHTAHHEP